MIEGNFLLDEDEVSQINTLIENVNELKGRNYVDVINSWDDDILLNIFVDGKLYSEYNNTSSVIMFLCGIKVALEEV